MSTQLPTRQARVVAAALHLATLKPRDTLTHDQICDDMGLDTKSEDQRVALLARGVFQDARRHATREHGVVLRSIRGIGYSRLTDAEVADDDSRMKRVRSQARRGLEELGTVDPRGLSGAMETKHAAKALVLAAVVTQTAPKAIRAIKPPTSPSAAKALLADLSVSKE